MNQIKSNFLFFKHPTNPDMIHYIFKHMRIDIPKERVQGKNQSLMINLLFMPISATSMTSSSLMPNPKGSGASSRAYSPSREFRKGRVSSVQIAMGWLSL